MAISQNTRTKMEKVLGVDVATSIINKSTSPGTLTDFEIRKLIVALCDKDAAEEFALCIKNGTKPSANVQRRLVTAFCDADAAANLHTTVHP